SRDIMIASLAPNSEFVLLFLQEICTQLSFDVQKPSAPIGRFKPGSALAPRGAPRSRLPNSFESEMGIHFVSGAYPQTHPSLRFLRPSRLCCRLSAIGACNRSVVAKHNSSISKIEIFIC
ncbi:MAG TPA: hypothetical protein VLZ73_03500, partial [Brevundimonas sp.]|nr:hypothetical protein [Brevundimonas sp.]